LDEKVVGRFAKPEGDESVRGFANRSTTEDNVRNPVDSPRR
jgi:hypothetical protein